MELKTIPLSIHRVIYNKIRKTRNSREKTASITKFADSNIKERRLHCFRIPLLRYGPQPTRLGEIQDFDRTNRSDHLRSSAPALTSTCQSSTVQRVETNSRTPSSILK